MGPVDEAVETIRRRWTGEPAAALILGTGLGSLADRIQIEAAFEYREVPHFPASTALAHAGRLICGRMAGTTVVAMQGRCHLYEGYSAEQVALPVRVMRRLGARRLIVSNASGGVNPQFAAGDVMVISDHVNLMWQAPGGVRMPGSATRAAAPRDPIIKGSPYDPIGIDQALAIARREDFAAHRGVYVALTGPNYETRAEYRMIRRIGGDAVGMSTVPEVMAAAQEGMPVLALSVITNVARPDAPQKTDAHHVVDVAQIAAPRVCAIVEAIVNPLPPSPLAGPAAGE